MTWIGRFWSKVKIGGPDDCWEWQGSRYRRGYGRFWVDGGQQAAHRVAYELENGAILGGLHVLHHCDNPPCVNHRHLFLGDAAVNQQDMTTKGRHRYGERNGRAKLTESLVIEIRRRIVNGERRIDIAEELGVSNQIISRIGLGEAWSHVGG